MLMKDQHLIDNYNNDAEKHLKEWREILCKEDEDNKIEHFVSDGVVDPDTWFSSDIRPLFLLKEAYSDETDADWSICNYLKEPNGDVPPPMEKYCDVGRRFD